MSKENGYTLARKFFDFSFENSRVVRPLHVALYFWCIEKNNRLGWVDEFQLPTSEGMLAVGIKDKNAFLKSIKDLQSWGAIKVLQESKNIHTARYISLKGCALASTGALDESICRMEKHDATHDGSRIEKHDATLYATHDATHTNNKLLNKETNKLSEFSFEQFWNMYEKKTDTAKCKAKWSKISEDDKILIRAAVTEYVLATPDVKFRKNPLTWLNGSCWLDQQVASEAKQKISYERAQPLQNNQR